MPRLDVAAIKAAKGQTPLVVLTAYTAPMAGILGPLVDILLVGDSLGMTIYGHQATRGISLDTMIAHGKAVTGAAGNCFVVIDLPFATYDTPELAFINARRVMTETGCHAVKLEGGESHEKIITALVQAGIPVMAHVGLLPQSVTDGNFKAKGREAAEAAQILADAKAVERAGAFAVVIEAVAEPLAVSITEAVSIPTIGIGASAKCDGQVLVIDDMLGMFERAPKFVKFYANLRETIASAAKEYADEVRSRRFPDETKTYKAS